MRKHKSNRIIGVLTFILLGVGLVVIYAIGTQRANFMNSAYGTDFSSNYFFIHQAISVVLSVIAFVVAFKYPYAKLRQYSKILMVLSIVACAFLGILALIGSSLASCQLGACRWINLGSFSVQPAEFLKLALVLYLAQLVAQHKAEGTFQTKDFWVPFGVVSGISLLFVVVLQKDLGTGVCLIAIILSILFMSGVETKSFLIVLAVVAAGGVGSILVSPHRLARLMTFNGDGDSDSSYHIDNAMMAIGTGGVFGVGVGNSVQATGYLPESINDSVFAVMGETFGLVGLLVIIGCFATLLLQLLGASARLPEEESLVVVGMFAWVAAHVVVNISAMTGLIPLTGITLPLLSFGGTSMLFISYGLGLSQQLSCYTSREVRKNEDISSRRGLGRAHYASSRRRQRDSRR